MIVQKNNTEASKITIKRRHITRIIWLIIAVTSLILLCTVDKVISLNIFGVLISIGTIFNLLFKYINYDLFSWDAYITISLSYMIVFFQMIIIPIDITLLTTTEINSKYKKTDIQEFLNESYKVIYWVSIIVNFIFLRFQLNYWNQCHPTFKERVFYTIKSLFKIVIILSALVFLIVIITIIIAGLKEGFKFLLTSVQILNYLFCIVHCGILLGYGLIEVPFSVWDMTNTTDKLENLLNNVKPFLKKYEKAINKVFADKILLLEQCQKIKKMNNHSSKEFADLIIQDITTYNIFFNDLVKFIKTKASVELSSNKEIDNDTLAEIFFNLKENFFHAKKKEASLLRLYIEIMNNCIPEENQKNTDSSDINISMNSIDTLNDSLQKEEKSSSRKTFFKYKYLIPKEYSFFMIKMTKILSLFIFAISIFILILFFNLYFISTYNIFSKILDHINDFYINFLFFFFIQGYLFMCCYYALTKFKITEMYILIPHHMNRYGLANNSDICCTISLGLTYYFVFVFGIFYNQDKGQTSVLNKFFKNMVKFPFIYNYFNYLFPTFILLVFGFIFLKKFNFLQSFTGLIKVNDFYSSKKEDNSGEIQRLEIYMILKKVEKLLKKRDVSKASQNEETAGDKENQNKPPKKISFHAGLLKHKKGFFMSKTYYFLLKEDTLFCYENEKSTNLIAEYSLLLLINFEKTDKGITLTLNNQKLELLSVISDDKLRKNDIENWCNSLQDKLK